MILKNQENYVRVGSDPETFLINKENLFISAVGLFGGTKNNPKDIGEGCFIQEDNVAVEFNTPPTNNVNEFVNAVNYNLDYIEKRAAELGLNIVHVPSAIFGNDQLNSYQAKTFGCDPDYNAWNFGSINKPPRNKNKNLRSAGGHIHIEAPELSKITLTQAMDLFVGLGMLEFDSDTDRRSLYGRAGAFRPKEYGIEYRTASNAWLIDDEKKKWVFDQTQKAVQFVKNNCEELPDNIGLLIQKAINNSDKSLIKEINLEIKNYGFH